MALRDKLDALILSRRDINEADRLLTIFSRSRGLLCVIAKGVRKIPSRRGGHVEPLCRVRCIITGHTGRLFLQAAEMTDDYAYLRQNPAAMEHAVFLAGVISRLYQEDAADEDMFDMMAGVWLALPQLSWEKMAAVEVATVWQALQANGLQPALKSCQVCGTIHPQEAVVLEAQEGGWACLPCRASLAGAGSSLTPRSLKALKWLAVYPQRAVSLKMDEDEARQLLAAVRRYLSETGVIGAKTGYNYEYQAI